VYDSANLYSEKRHNALETIASGLIATSTRDGPHGLPYTSI